MADDATIEGYKERFSEFFSKYCKEDVESLALSYPDKVSMAVDFRELEKFDPELASELIESPDDLLDASRLALRELIGKQDEEKDVNVRIFGQSVNSPLVQDVGSSYIGKMIALDSLIVKRSEIIPKVKVGVYKCSFCDATYKIRVDRDEVPEICDQCKRKALKQPEICDQCKRKALKQVPEESHFLNLQKIAVQDPLEKLSGSTPTWQLEVWIEDDLVNTVIPGDRIELTGILRIRPRRNFRGKQEKNFYSMFLETVSIVPKQKEFADLDISEEEERRIIELSKDPGIFEKVAKSIAPSIYGYDEIKEAVTLQLFGGTAGKMLVDGGTIRSDMHILLIGDPGSAKTRILQAVSRLVPKGIYVSGKSVTGGGMTGKRKDKDTASGVKACAEGHIRERQVCHRRRNDCSCRKGRLCRWRLDAESRGHGARKRRHSRNRRI
ncbi:MAG: hypothetical protein M1564_00340 [Candidatus Marsarchaeota archaeon]|nr:hypothetical protein [Candidatus Marsarchaeota archaeon]